MIKQNIKFIILLTFATIFCGAQESLNQFDANGKRHGKWQKNFDGTNVLRYTGQFDHGKEVGTFTFYQKVGKVSKIAATREFNSKDDIAKVTFYALNGKIVSEGMMDGKTYIGKWKYYHKNSDKLMTVEHYSNDGELQGKRLVFYENGQVAEELNYQAGKIDGISNYYSEEGTMVKKYTYRNGELHGETKHYENNGAISIEGQYQNGHKHGVWKYYRNGKLYDQKDFTRYSKNPKKQKKN